MVDGKIMENVASRYVYIVDDEPLVCRVLCKALEQAGLKASGFGCADDCLACLGTEPCDLLISDIRMPGTDGIDLLRQVRRLQPWLPVLLMTGFGDVPIAVEALKAGAADFIEKPLDKHVFLGVVRGLLSRNTTPSTVLNRSLTGMEARILQHILEGRNNRQIADALHRSSRTVEVHRCHLMRKMGASNIVELLRRAAEYRLFDTGSSAPEPARRDRRMRGHGHADVAR